MSAAEPAGRLYLGDNLAVLRRHVGDASIDLVYLDPPFSSGRAYHVLYGGEDELHAFDDAWAWGPEAERAFEAVVARADGAGRALRAMRDLLGPGDMLAYLAMMAPRLAEARRVLRPSGSLYVHCDPTASHYLKVLLDAVLGVECFRNEIVWRYRRWPAASRQLQKMHDVLLFYSREAGGQHVFHTLYGYEKLAASTLRTFGTKKQRADFSSGHRKPGREAEDTVGPPLSDVWEVSVIAPIAKERLGFPTQKPEALLERVVLASSREGDVVLDPFCGSGTTLAVAQRLGRRFVGIDRTHLAIGLARHRLEGASGGRPRVEVVGEPRTIDEVRALASASPQELRAWLLARVGASPAGAGRGAGTAAVLLRKGEGPRAAPRKVAVLEVEPGRVAARHVRALEARMEAEGIAIGALLTVEEPTADAERAAARAGANATLWGSVPRVQILTAARVLAGEGVEIEAEAPPAAAR